MHTLNTLARKEIQLCDDDNGAWDEVCVLKAGVKHNVHSVRKTCDMSWRDVVMCHVREIT